MLERDIEKRIEEIEVKIEELENMILDNKLKIMSLMSEKKEPTGFLNTYKKGESKINKNTDELTSKIEKIRKMLSD